MSAKTTAHILGIDPVTHARRWRILAVLAMSLLTELNSWVSPVFSMHMAFLRS